MARMNRKHEWKTGCDVEATLRVIGGRWKPILICRLMAGRKRFSELCRLAPNATQRMITLQLKELEADGIITRHVYAEVPPRVEYQITEFGRSLEPIIESMQAWGLQFKSLLAVRPDSECTTKRSDVRAPLVQVDQPMQVDQTKKYV